MKGKLISLKFRGIINPHLNPRIMSWLIATQLEYGYIEFEYDYGADTTIIRMFDKVGIAKLRQAAGEWGFSEIIDNTDLSENFKVTNSSSGESLVVWDQI